MLKYGDKVKAIDGTTAAIFAEGRTGVIAEVRTDNRYSWNTSQNLLRWGNENILMGFRHDEVVLIDV